MNLKETLLLGIALFIFMPLGSLAQEDDTKTAHQYNLDGVFGGGGGKYYLRQLGNEILWYGEEDAVSTNWLNVTHGTISGNTITVKWADVPNGSIRQSGNLVIRIDSNDVLVLTGQTGEFFGTDSWTRVP